MAKPTPTTPHPKPLPLLGRVEPLFDPLKPAVDTTTTEETPLAINA